MTSPAPRRTGLAAVTAALVAAVTPFTTACAERIARVDVYDRTQDQALPLHRHRGRSFVEGTPGHEYAVRIRNCTGERILAVLSVDGVNAVTGETASPAQSGYVIEPWGYVTVQGWRKGLDRTAAFHFTDPQDAYVTRTGRPDDLGVIGVALFRERRDPPDAWIAQSAGAAREAAPSADAAKAESRRDSASAAESAAPAARSPSLGTGHGRNEWSPVQTVAFERASDRPDEVVRIRYETREELVAMGVLRPWRPLDREPQPFPATMGFVPDP